jgi:hypothetical protein
MRFSGARNLCSLLSLPSEDTRRKEIAERAI